MDEKKALVIVDEQVDFCEGGALEVHGGAHVCKRTAEYMASHDKEYMVTVATKDWHPDSGRVFTEAAPGYDKNDYAFKHFSEEPDYQNTWPPHCVQGTHGADFHVNLLPEVHRIDRVFFKGQEDAAYSGFEGVLDMEKDRIAILDGGWDIEGVETGSLDWYLKYWDITHVDVCGLALDYCVRATAIDAADLGYHTRVLVNLTASVNGATAQHALLEMGQHGVEVTVAST